MLEVDEFAAALLLRTGVLPKYLAHGLYKTAESKVKLSRTDSGRLRQAAAVLDAAVGGWQDAGSEVQRLKRALDSGSSAELARLAAHWQALQLRLEAGAQAPRANNGEVAASPGPAGPCAPPSQAGVAPTAAEAVAMLWSAWEAQPPYAARLARLAHLAGRTDMLLRSAASPMAPRSCVYGASTPARSVIQLMAPADSAELARRGLICTVLGAALGMLMNKALNPPRRW